VKVWSRKAGWTSGRLDTGRVREYALKALFSIMKGHQAIQLSEKINLDGLYLSGKKSDLFCHM